MNSGNYFKELLDETAKPTVETGILLEMNLMPKQDEYFVKMNSAKFSIVLLAGLYSVFTSVRPSQSYPITINGANTFLRIC